MAYSLRLRRGPFDPPPAQEEEVEQTIRLLTGDVAFNTPGVKTYPGISMFTIPAGSLLISAGFVRTSVFTESEASLNSVYWGLAAIDDLSDWIDTVSATTDQISTANTLPELFYEPAPLALAAVPILLPDGAQIVCHMQANVTGGAATIVALIAEPAS